MYLGDFFSTCLPFFLSSFISAEGRYLKESFLKIYLLFENNIQDKVPDFTVFEPPCYSQLSILDSYAGQKFFLFETAFARMERLKSKKKNKRGGLDRNFCLFSVSPQKKNQLNWDALKHGLRKNRLSQSTLDCLSTVSYKLLCGYRCISHHCYRRLFVSYFYPFLLASFCFFTEYDCHTGSLFLLSSSNATFQFFSGNEIMITWKSFSFFPTVVHQVLGWSFH